MFMSRKKTLGACLAVLAILATTGIVRGVVVGFDGITSNNAGDVTAGQQQLWMDVAALGSNQAQFTFYNTGTASSVITQVYFEHGHLSDLAGIYDAGGVSFQEGGSPKSLPAGNGLSPAFNTAFRVSADNPSPQNGVSNGPATGGDWVRVVFNLNNGTSFQDLLNDLGGGSLRIGLHVQGFDSGGSESFIDDSYSVPPVPEPATVGFGIAGLLMAGVLRGHRKHLQITG